MVLRELYYLITLSINNWIICLGFEWLTSLLPHYVLQVMLESSVYLTLSVYCCCCLLAAVASCALPIETTGRGLQESSHREWGQEMMGRASNHSPDTIPRSSSGSQNWRREEWRQTREEAKLRGQLRWDHIGEKIWRKLSQTTKPEPG